jgi:hypothetical protein
MPAGKPSTDRRRLCAGHHAPPSTFTDRPRRAAVQAVRRRSTTGKSCHPVPLRAKPPSVRLNAFDFSERTVTSRPERIILCACGACVRGGSRGGQSSRSSIPARSMAGRNTLARSEVRAARSAISSVTGMARPCSGTGTPGQAPQPARRWPTRRAALTRGPAARPAGSPPGRGAELPGPARAVPCAPENGLQRLDPAQRRADHHRLVTGFRVHAIQSAPPGPDRPAPDGAPLPPGLRARLRSRLRPADRADRRCEP